MERFWLKNYPAGVPADIDGSQYRSLAELIGIATRRCLPVRRPDSS